MPETHLRLRDASSKARELSLDLNKLNVPRMEAIQIAEPTGIPELIFEMLDRS